METERLIIDQIKETGQENADFILTDPKTGCYLYLGYRPSGKGRDIFYQHSIETGMKELWQTQ